MIGNLFDGFKAHNGAMNLIIIHWEDPLTYHFVQVRNTLYIASSYITENMERDVTSDWRLV